MKAVDYGNGGVYFIDAPGDTGKTFLNFLLLASVRSRTEIALAISKNSERVVKS
jgi:hypothetical protein